MMKHNCILIRRAKVKKSKYRPGRPVVKTSHSKAGDMSSIPGWGARIPHALWPKN